MLDNDLNTRLGSVQSKGISGVVINDIGCSGILSFSEGEDDGERSKYITYWNGDQENRILIETICEGPYCMKPNSEKFSELNYGKDSAGLKVTYRSIKEFLTENLSRNLKSREMEANKKENLLLTSYLINSDGSKSNYRTAKNTSTLKVVGYVDSKTGILFSRQDLIKDRYGVWGEKSKLSKR